MPDNIMVNAGAGTGKTFCVTEGVYRMVGQKRKTEGSEEQQAIWECMSDDSHPGCIHMTSFTNDASDQLANLSPMGPDGKPLASSKSTYGMGLACAKARGMAGYIDRWGSKYKGLTTAFLGATKFELNKRYPGLWDAVHETQKYARLNLIRVGTKQQIKMIADWFAVDIPTGKNENGERLDDVVVEGVNEVLRAGREELGQFDFIDMIYQPVMHDIVRKKYETIIVDEAQDMGLAQQEVILRSSYRRIMIGDPHQAIFGFAGADSEAFPRLHKYLEDTYWGVKSFPLNMTRRCAKAIVAEANKRVPSLKAMPDAKDGIVHKMHRGDFLYGHLDSIIKRYTANKPVKLFGPKDFMVICPTNAPLISVMFRLKEMGVNAFINGGDITESMINFIQKHSDGGMGELRIAIEDHLEMLQSKKRSKNRDIQLDIYTALQDIAKICHTPAAMISTIGNMFSDTRRPGWIELSSIHKAKGREADTVVVWNVDRCKSPYSVMEWQHQQDINLEYVADTRAKNFLYKVSSL